MDVSLEKKNAKPKYKILIISLAVIVFLTFIISLQIIFSVLQNKKIYKGVYADGINAGGLLPEELHDRLETKYKNEYKDAKLTISSQEIKEKFLLQDFDFLCDIDNTINEAYSIGREGNIIQRLMKVINTSFNEVEITSEIMYDSDKIDNIVNYFYSNIYIPLEEPDFKIDKDFALISSGHNGKSIDKEKLRNEILDFINKRKSKNVDIQINITKKSYIDIDTLFNKINSKPVNAYTKVENGQLVIIPHKNGINVDKESLEIAVDKLNRNEDKIEKVKLNLIIPKITEYEINKNLFKDVLSSYRTYYSTDGQINIDRTENIRLASKKINGKILAPGDIFSFNETVGERSEANGYKNAYIFVAGKIVEGLGGGICQVSSTLYNSVLLANLNIVERSNHIFTVSYVKNGLDATVSYGTIDFKFKNSTNWPIKIETYMTKNNELVFSLLGTKENKGLSVELLPQVIKTNPFKTIYIDDPSLPEGTTVVRQNGLNGYVVDTYKIIKQDGKEINRTKITTSVYTPLEKRVSRGTKKTKGSQIQQPEINKNSSTIPEDSTVSDYEKTVDNNVIDDSNTDINTDIDNNSTGNNTSSTRTTDNENNINNTLENNNIEDSKNNSNENTSVINNNTSNSSSSNDSNDSSNTSSNTSSNINTNENSD